MLCQFFLPNLNVGCALLISEIKLKKKKSHRKLFLCWWLSMAMA